MRMIILLAAFLAVSVAPAQEPKGEKNASGQGTVSKEAAACRKTALDYRVLGLNALKNADAARAKTHEALIKAMDAGDPRLIDQAADDHEDAADDLSDTIEAVAKLVAYAMKADGSAKAVGVMCTDAGTAEGAAASLDLEKTTVLLETANRSLAKAERLVGQLRRDWLAPSFASTNSPAPVPQAGTGQ